MFPTARSLDDVARGGGITATFHAGGTALGHHWQLSAQDGTTLARTARVHSGGMSAQMFWKFVTITGLDANNDIHVDVAELTCEGDGPWPVLSPESEVLGELLAGEPGPSLSPELWHWVDPQWALNTASYARTMHLGLRRVKRYSLAPTTSGHAQPPAVALRPLLAGLTY